MRRMLMILALAFVFSFPAFVWPGIYKWVDEKGTVHFTEDPGTIPEKYTEKTQSTTTNTILGSPSGQDKEEERITYYYRDPRPNELIPILESILRQKDTISHTKTVKPLVHFFATALQKDLNKVKDLKALRQNYSGEAGRLIQILIEEARNYHPANLKSAEDLELLWSEYKASGNKEIIERLIKVITGTAPSKVNNLRDPVKQFLTKFATYHYEVFETLRKRSESSIGNERNAIGEIVSIIRHSAFDPADNHLNRGLNLYNERKYNEAMQEFNKSLSYVPDYCSTYMNIANIYDDQNRIEEAIRAGKRAVSIEPDNPGALSNLALYYYRSKEYDEAINWYQKCLEYDPRKTDCLYGLGVSYVQKQDNDKPVVYFKKYLQYAPNGKHAAYIKGYLASVGKASVEDPADIAAMLDKKRFDDLEKHLISLLREKKRDKEGNSLLALAYGKLVHIQEVEESDFLYAKKILQFKEWQEQSKASHFANACLGSLYIHHAWFARGTGWGSTITDQGGALFENRLLNAKRYLEEAYSSAQSDPYVPAELIAVAMGLGLERKEMEKQFKRAILADPNDHQAYFGKLNYLMPKWYGSEEEMFSFAREAVRKAPPNSKIPVVLAVAHWEMYLQSGENASYFRNLNVWKEMKEVYQTVTKRFPEAKSTHNWFAKTAYLAGDYKVAREELEKIGDDWDKRAWGDKKTFEEVKRELLAR